MSLSRNLSGCQVFRPEHLPADWDCDPLKERLELLYGRALREEDRRPGETVVFGSNGSVGTHNAKWLDPPGVLVGRKGTVGSVHYTNRPYWPIDTVYYVHATREDYVRYLYYLLDYLPLRFLNAATGVPGLSRRDAYALRGAFPGQEEQAAIVRILDAVDNTINETRDAMDRAKDVRRALRQRLFSHGTRGERQKKTRIGWIPQSWDVIALSTIVDEFQYGLSVPMQTSGHLPILRMGNIQDGDVLLRDLKYVTLLEKRTAPCMLKRGDVLFNRTNSQELVGKIGVYRSDVAAVFASYLIRLKMDPDFVDNYFIGQLLDSNDTQCRIKRYATPGVQQVNINAKNLGKALIPFPPVGKGLDEQKDIAAILEHADSTIRSFVPKLDRLAELKRALSNDLFTGRIRVKTISPPNAVGVA